MGDKKKTNMQYLVPEVTQLVRQGAKLALATAVMGVVIVAGMVMARCCPSRGTALPTVVE